LQVEPKAKNQNKNRQQDGLIATDQVITNRMPTELGTNHGRQAPRRYWCAYQTIFRRLDLRACFIDASLRETILG